MAIGSFNLGDAILTVLSTADAREKAHCARSVSKAWRSGGLSLTSSGARLPDRPARPEAPELRLPRDVPRRKITSAPAGRIALLHALAHIELNAIDLAFDIVGRFMGVVPDGERIDFVNDWITVGDDEARHFLMLDDRLRELDAAYGDLPAHDGLWQASMDTAHDILARLAIVPMVLEARGLDVTPTMIEKLRAAQDMQSADILQTIHDDEITHVAAGTKWFNALCHARDLDALGTWQALVQQHFKGGIKPPFNTDSRDKAGFPQDFYAPLAVGR